MSCFHPIWITQNGRRLQVPCGKCVACQSSRSNNWFVRLEFENRVAKDSYFLTLTFSEDNVPKKEVDGKVLNVLDNRYIQLYIKRLRRSLEYHGYSGSVRYFFVGEYGPTTLRPHYHGALFFSERLNLQQYKALIYEKWNFGYKKINRITSGRMRYIVSYTTGMSILPPEYVCARPRVLCSRACGLEYFMRYYADYYTRKVKELPVLRKLPGIRLEKSYCYNLPSYFKKKIFTNVERTTIKVYNENAFRQRRQEEVERNILYVRNLRLKIENHERTEQADLFKFYYNGRWVDIRTLIEEEKNALRKRDKLLRKRSI